MRSRLTAIEALEEVKKAMPPDTQAYVRIGDVTHSVKAGEDTLPKGTTQIGMKGIPPDTSTTIGTVTVDGTTIDGAALAEIRRILKSTGRNRSKPRPAGSQPNAVRSVEFSRTLSIRSW